MSETSKKSNLSKQTLAIYWQHARKYKRQLWQIYPTMVVAQLIEDFLQPVIISAIITLIAQNRLDELTFAKLWPLFLIIIACEVVGHSLWNRVVIPIFWRTQDSVFRDLAMTAFNHLSSMSYRFYSDRFAGSLVNQTNKFVGSFERLTEALTWTVFRLIVAFVATCVILLPKAPLIVLALVIITVIYIPLVWHYRKLQTPLNRSMAAAESRRTGQLADSISNILAVKAFSNEQHESELMKKRVDDVSNNSLKVMRFSMDQELGIGFVQRSINISTILISVLLAASGSLEVGIIYLSLTFTIGLMRKLWDLNRTFRDFTRVFGDAHDMTEILLIKPEIADDENAEKFTAKTGAIDFKDVTFWYPESNIEDSLFSGLNLTIKSGEKIGLVGPSGGGKTTITKLLLRFMDIQQGTIEIDGTNTRHITQADLRHSITYVPQEPLLFHRSIKENIAYGSSDASDSEIIEAAKKARADEFIAKLPDGYETMVGERGVKLSGGQKQRIAIARAMLKDAPIVILDEATSALDSESEVAIQAALKDLMKNKTAVVIAHRLSTIQNMDKIVVLDNGKVVEQGSHDTLRKKKNGLYARLWNHQSGGFIQE